MFTCAADGTRFLELFAREAAQQRWRCHGWCLMETGYQLLVETPEPNLGRGMGRFAMAYSQWFGRRYHRPGHLFASRYKAILFEKPRWLLPLARHVVTEPVRAGLVRRAEQWHWSSYRALSQGPAPAWLAADEILSGFGATPAERRDGWAAYVACADSAPSPWAELRGGHYLGGPAFLRDIAARIDGRSLDQIPRAAAAPNRPTAEEVLAAVAAAADLRPDEVLDRKKRPDAWRVAVYLLRRAANRPIRETAALAGVSQGRVSQVQRSIEESGGLRRAVLWAEPLAALVAD